MSNREFQKTGGWCQGDQRRRLETVTWTVTRYRLHGSGFDACSNHKILSKKEVQEQEIPERITIDRLICFLLDKIKITKVYVQLSGLSSRAYPNPVTSWEVSGLLSTSTSSNPRFHQNYSLHTSAISVACFRATLQYAPQMLICIKTAGSSFPTTTQASSSFETSLPSYI